MEIFKDVKGYEGLYKIGDHGTVISCAKINRGKMRPETKIGFLKNKYMHCNLSKNKVKILTQIHRLVGFHFVDGYKDGLVINHKDGVKTNNHYSNLEWCTREENNLHAKITGLLNSKCYTRLQVRNLTTGEIYSSIFEAALSFGVIYSTMRYHLHFKPNRFNCEYVDTSKTYKKGVVKPVKGNARLNFKIKEDRQTYYRENKDRIMQQSRMWYKQNKKLVLERAKENYKNKKNKATQI